LNLTSLSSGQIGFDELKYSIQDDIGQAVARYFKEGNTAQASFRDEFNERFSLKYMSPFLMQQMITQHDLRRACSRNGIRKERVEKFRKRLEDLTIHHYIQHMLDKQAELESLEELKEESSQQLSEVISNPEESD